MKRKVGLQMQTYPMYGPVGAPFQKEPNSPRGVRWCIIAFAIYLGVLIAQIVYGVWGAVNLDSLASSSYYNYSAMIMVFAFTAITIILEILVLVFYLVGFGYLYGGRNEFSPNHARHVNVAMGLIIAAIVTTVVGSIITLALQFQTFFSYYGHPDSGIYYGIVGAGAVMNTLVAAFVATAIVLPVHGLVDQKYDRHLYIAAGLGTATPGIVSAFAFWQLPGIIDALSNGYSSSNLSTSTGWPTLMAGILGLVTFLIFLMIYLNVSTRIREGQLKPTRPPVSPVVWIPVQVVPMMPAYPMYPPYAPAQPVMPQQPVQPAEPGKQGSTQQGQQRAQ
jgi:hypothetical protein